jgi:histone acetyltransferase (RNA polymerase elongator complex component)
LAITKHFTIPVFIPELGCPNQCVFCNQRKISGSLHVPDVREVETIIQKHLSTIPGSGSHVEIGFFGGNFTGLDPEVQRQYLSVASRFLSPASCIRGIRVSTRPDYIDDERLSLLKDSGVTTVELGAQSMDEEVLKRTGRGHTVKDTERASDLVLRRGLSLGLQMMIGLPGDTIGKSLYTAQRIIELGADNTRIYPTLVIQGTALADLYRKGHYSPLPLDEAVRWSVPLCRIFEKAGVKIIRMGLHPSEGLITGTDLVAGPYHPSFRELVETELWKEELRQVAGNGSSGPVTITVSPDHYNGAIGHRAANKKMLLERFRQVKFNIDPSLKGRAFYVDYH